MNLTLKRYSDNGESTLGLLLLDGNFFCYTVEDTNREVKVVGKTRIPAGYYKIELRNEGTKTKRYAMRYPEMHKGMLWLRAVNNFKYVYIHIGNKAEDSEGCILIGDSANNNILTDGLVSSSADAYKRLYPLVSEAILSGKQVFIKVLDERE